ncbi:hypothetical protein K8O61_04510 [Xanthomonas cerealis pv. cerealis]|uniref:hypothetical protein n=1 Tax=Xanthomonas cerealis TaxID=3390025 RepID=UPI001F1BB319|nr:hypothetical protein [Xanthomonas translucens]UKE71441.1 hypothetical protein K8O61_04510 [Xanthomonas translucens pv. pistacia]
MFDPAPQEIARRHGAVGADLGGRTRRSQRPSSPTIMAVENAVALVQKQQGAAMAGLSAEPALGASEGRPAAV